MDFGRSYELAIDLLTHELADWFIEASSRPETYCSLAYLLAPGDCALHDPISTKQATKSVMSVVATTLCTGRTNVDDIWTLARCLSDNRISRIHGGLWFTFNPSGADSPTPPPIPSHPELPAASIPSPSSEVSCGLDLHHVWDLHQAEALRREYKPPCEHVHRSRSSTPFVLLEPENREWALKMGIQVPALRATSPPQPKTKGERLRKKGGITKITKREKTHQRAVAERPCTRSQSARTRSQTSKTTWTRRGSGLRQKSSKSSR